MNPLQFLVKFLKNKYEGRLIETSSDLKNTSDMFLEDIIEGLRALFDVEAVSVFAINHDLEEVYAIKSAGAGTEDLNKITIKFGIGIVGHTAKDKNCIISNNPESDVRFNKGFDRKTGFKTRNILSYPVIFDDKVIAIIELINKPEEFTDEDKAYLDKIFSELKDLFRITIKSNSYKRN